MSNGLKKRIIPCLDVDQGRVVKGVKYVDHVDAGDPVEVAKRYDAQEADEITFLDITASSVDANKTGLYMGCGGHPSWIGHAKAAEIAEPLLKAVMHW